MPSKQTNKLGSIIDVWNPQERKAEVSLWFHGLLTLAKAI